MYSVEAGGVVTHHLPWERGNPKLDNLVALGFTYEKPDEKIPSALIEEAIKGLDEVEVPQKSRKIVAVSCPQCGKVCKPQGLHVHMRFCKKVLKEKL